MENQLSFFTPSVQSANQSDLLKSDALTSEFKPKEHFENLHTSVRGTDLLTIFESVKNDSTKKFDLMVEEQTIRLDDKLEVNGVGFTKNGLATLNTFTRIPHSMMEYQYTMNYFADYARYLNHELDLRREKPRVSKEFLVRYRKTDNGELIRGVMSNRYGIIDNVDVIDAVIRGIPGVVSDCVVSNYRNDGDEMYSTVYLPDYNKVEDSEYSCGFTITNSEVRSTTYNIKPFIYRRVDQTGYVYDKKDSVVRMNMKHSGKINKDKVETLTKSGINTALDLGRNLIDKFEWSKRVQISNAIRLIAALCREYKFSIQEGRRWYTNYLQSEYKTTAFGIINSLSVTAKEYEDETRAMLEGATLKIAIPSLDSSFEEIQKRWSQYQSKAQLLDEKVVAQYEPKNGQLDLNIVF